MATIDLGKIKQVWRGTYNNSTAYTVDDLVEYTDNNITSSYICVADSTGNAPSSGGTAHASWNYVAKGVVDPIPSQSGHSGKFLTTNGSALSFGAVTEADMVKIHSTGAVSGNVINFDNYYDSSKYENYKLVINGWYCSSSPGNVECRLKDGSGNDLTGAYYRGVTWDAGLAYGDHFYSNSNKWNGYTYMRLHDGVTNGGSIYKTYIEFDIYRPHEANQYPVIRYYGQFWDSTDWMEIEHGSFWYTSSTATRGFRFFNANNVTMYMDDIILYGLKG